MGGGTRLVRLRQSISPVMNGPLLRTLQIAAKSSSHTVCVINPVGSSVYESVKTYARSVR